jgi:pentapeptide repeat protein
MGVIIKNKIRPMRHIWNRLFNLTGFHGKTAWDWLGLLLVPVVILGATGALVYFGEQAENQRAEALLQIEDDRVEQSVLQSYIQDMTELLLDKGLATAGPTLPVRRIARSSTLTAIRQLDGDRKGILLQFLYESNLIQRRGFAPIISLRRADLRDANLRGARLSGTYLERADLTNAENWPTSSWRKLGLWLERPCLME